MKRIALLALGLLVSGCAEKWAKPGATEPDFRAMQAQCEAAAFDRWPPVLREVLMSPGYFVPLRRHCDSRGRCSFFGGFFEPPQYTTIDEHQGPRRTERRACFFANGWTPVED